MSKKQEYNAYHADCYVLGGSRSADFIYSFLERFVPNRKEMANEYEVPQYSDNPKSVFKTTYELIEYLVEHKGELYTAYWLNTEDTELKAATCSFTREGQVIVGLSCQTLFPDTSIEDRYLSQLSEFCGSDLGYIAYEEPPSHDAYEFEAKVKTYRGIT